MKKKYIIRLDDAAECMDVQKWQKMENVLDAYNVKPLVGVIPDCKDPMMKEYDIAVDFWDKVRSWELKNWVIAMHGYQHLYDSDNGGINPVNDFSEFAGHSLAEQQQRIFEGYRLLCNHGICAKVFFAPGHTFDDNTLKALESETPIRIISDTFASDVYQYKGFTYIPQQCGNARKLPFRVCTFAYHPNTMLEKDFLDLDNFLRFNSQFFSSVDEVISRKRKKNVYDLALCKAYFIFRKIRNLKLFR